ncbi:Amuc_1100 family pilus-like protein [Luteolibacter algae]|uniref:Amuc_1100 family pilus-like protein n=1 Tax=Luteolibacter algae TaxID=454151 RepID=A0ABW5DA18_9BACT
MNWIKNNPFVAILSGITLVLCAMLLFVASRGAAKYEAAQEGFEEAYQNVSKSESIPLYPKAENRDAKRKALEDHRVAIEGLSKLFDKFRPEKIENISTQDFTVRLKEANTEVSQAFEDAGCELPDGFFLGFESYRDQLAKSDATGVLNYQLEGVKHALLDLAAARPSQLIKVYREAIPEENGGQPQIGPNDVTRNFGFEFSFKGSEAAARKFISSLGDTDPYYYIVRSLKIVNENDAPPRVSDAKFETAKTAETPESNVDDTFGGFVVPGSEEPVEETPAAAPEPAAPAADSSRILAQVLGGEEVIVFVRFDLTMFLPSKELPKP